MLNLSLKELELVKRNRSINGDKTMSIYDLLSIVNTSEPIKHYRKGDRKNLFTLKREEIKRSLYKPMRKNLFKSKRKEIGRIFFMSQEEKERKRAKKKNSWNIFFKLKKYYDDNSDSIKYKWLRDIKTLFEPEENYSKSIRTGNGFSNN